MRLAPPALILALLLVNCVPPPAHCGGVARLVANPTGATVPGVKAGPLFFAIGGWREEQEARIGWARRADLIKVLIQPLEQFDHPLTVEGRRCDDGSLMRFAEGPVWIAGPDRTPPPDDVIDRLTSVRREIPPPFGLANLSQPPFVAHGGYFIFSAPGRWSVEIRDGQRLICSFVMTVDTSRPAS